MPRKSQAEVHVRDDKFQNSIEILVPAGLSHKEIGKITLSELLSRFRPSGCQACLSGQHFNIREKFEKVLPVEIGNGSIGI
jgi:hypothetical protein